MSRAAGHRPAGRRNGVALGVLGIMLLAFFAIVFMLGRPGHWKSFNDFVHHPFDPHPIGIDKRHKETTITLSKDQSGEKLGSIDSITAIKITADGKYTSLSQTRSTGAGDGTSAASTSVAGTATGQGKDSSIGATASGSNTAKGTAPIAGGNVATAGADKPASTQQAAGQDKGAAASTTARPAVSNATAAAPAATTAGSGDKGNSAAATPTTTPTAAPTTSAPSSNTTAATGAATSSNTTAGSSSQGSDEDDDGKVTTLDNEYKPTREMVQRIAQNGYLVVTWANYHYFDFVRSWVDHVRAVGVTGYLVGAMDDHLLREMIALKYNCFSMKSGLTLGDFGWGSPTFAKMGREKIRLISIFLKLDVSVVIADVDVLWLRNPLPYFDRYPEADILTSSDATATTVKDESLEKWPDAGAAANIGIMLFRNRSLPFVEKWIQIIEEDEKVWDQNAFNDLFRKGWKLIDPPNKNLFLGYDGTLTMGILPVSLFCSGHTMFVQRMGYTLGLQPYAVHATFQFSGTPGKRHRMREFMLYSDPPEYYDHAVGFISFDMDNLPELLKHAGPATDKMDLANVQGHFRLVNHQLLRLRTAFAISTLLHRALVVPPLWCGLDRWWAPHPGRIPGSNFKLPFQCPLDHVIDLENGVFKHLPEDHYGPRTEIREYSFFNNTAMTPRVRDDRVVVELCAPGAADCSDGREPAKMQIDGGVSKIRIQAGLPSAALETAVSGVRTTKVLHFATMANAMGEFSDPGVAGRFTNRMKLYGSIWCCVLAHPGHIHYDLLWDQAHVDKFMRTWNGTWSTVTGP